MEFVELENRVTPATASVASNVLTVSFTAGNESAFITSSASGIRVGTSANDNSLLADTTGIVAIQVTDAGGFASQSLNLDGSTAYSLTTAGLTISGIETVTFTNPLTTTGSVSVTAATTAININTTAITSTGTQTYGNTITLGNNATLSAGGTGVSLQSVVLGANRLTIAGAGTASTIAGAITGSGGSFTKTGAGTLSFTGALANTYDGVTTLDQGILILAKTGGAVAVAGPVTMGGGNTNQPYLRTGQSNQFGPGVVMTQANAAGNWVRFDLIGTTQTLAGLQDTLGGLVVQNAGISAGTATNATLNLNGSGSYTHNGYIRNFENVNNGGILLVNYSGAGTHTISGSNINYTGATTVASTATLRMTNTSAFASAINNAGIVEFNTTTSHNLGSNVSLSGAGTWNKIGSQTLTFSGTQSITASGQFNILAGRLQNGGNAVNWTGNTASIFIDAGATLDLLADPIFADKLTGTGTVTNTWGNPTGFSGSSASTERLVLGVAGGSSTFAGIITDSGTGGNGSNQGLLEIEKRGAGTLTLTNANTFRGITTITAGAINLSNSLALQNSGVILNGGTGVVFDGSVVSKAFTLGGVGGSGSLGLVDNGGFTIASLTLGNNGTTTFTHSGVLSGGAAVIKAGSNTQIFSGANVNTGTFAVNSGVLQFAKPSSLYNANQANWTPANITVASGATLGVNIGGTNDFTPALANTLFTNLSTVTSNGLLAGSNVGFDTTNATAPVTYSLPIVDSTGAGGGALGINKRGTGTLILSGANTYSGTTVVTGGILQFAAANALYSGNTANWIPANFNVSSGAILAVNVGGASDFTLSDTTTLLTNLSTAINNNGLRAGAIFGFDTTNSPTSLTYSSVIANSTGTGSGALGIAKLGTGTLVLTGTNTYTGVTNILGGVLQVGDAGTVGTLGTGAVTITSPGNLTFNRTNSYTQASAISGTGSLTQAGTGTVTLTGGGGINYTGATAINAGQIILFNATGYNSPTTVADGAKMSWSGNTTVQNNSTAATILLNNGATLENINPSNWVVTNGAVTVAPGASATINLSSNTVTTAVAGFFLDGGLKGVAGTTVTINAANAGSGVNFRNNNTTFAGTMIVNGIASATPFAGSGISVGGNTTGLQNADIQLNGTMELLAQGIGWANAASGNFAMRGLSGTGIVVGNHTSGGIVNLTIGGTATGSTFSGVIANGNGNTVNVIKNTTGTQVFSGGNLYSGLTTVQAGTLALGATNSIRSGNNVTVSGTGAGTTATFDLAGFNQTLGTLTLGGSTATSSSVVTNSTGSSVLTVTGGANGIVYSAAGNSLPTTISVTTLDLNGAAQTITAGDSTTTAYELTISSAVQNGSIIKTGAGTAVLSGTNIYTGTTTVNAGILEFAKTASFYNNGTIAGGWTTTNLIVASGAIAAFNVGGAGEFTVADIQNTLITLGDGTGGFLAGSSIGLDITNFPGGTWTYSSVITNTNSNTTALGLAKLGTGTLVLTADNTYTGPTTVVGGVLQIGDGTSGSIASNAITTNGTLNYNVPGNLTLSASIGGTGGLTKSGSGTLTLSGVNTYTGATNISAGTLKLATPTTALPSSISGNTVWLDATDVTNTGSNPASGTQISTWVNKATSGAGNFTRTSSSTNPYFFSSGNTMNGLPLVHFFGGVLTNTTNFGNTLTVMYVSRLTGGSNLRVLSATNNWLLGYHGGGYNAAFWVSGGVAPGPIAANYNTHIFGAVGTGTSATSYNLDAAETQFDTRTTYTGPNGLMLGGYGTVAAPTETSYADFGELLVFNTALNATQRLQMQQYLQAKWYGVLPSTSAITVASGATFDLNGVNQTVGSISGPGQILLGGATLTVGGDNSSTTYSGVISGSGNSNLIKIGSGILTLAGTDANTYAGLTTVSQGGLVLGKSAGVAAIPGNLNIGLSLNPSVWATADNQLTSNTVVSFINEPNGASITNGWFLLNGTTQTIAGIQQTDASRNGVFQNAQTGAPLAPVATADGTVILAGSGNYSFNGYLRNLTAPGKLNVIKSGSGVQTLSGDRISYTGTTTINAGKLTNFNANQFASATTINSGSTLELAGTQNAEHVAGFTLTINNNGTLLKTNTGYNTFNANTVTLSGNTFINITNNGSSNQLFLGGGNGGLTGSGTLTVTNTGTSLTALTLRYGVNATRYNGSIIVNGGALNIGASAGLVLDNTDLTLNGAALTIDNSSFSSGATNASVKSITGDASSSVKLGGQTLTIGTNNGGATTFAGVISGTGGIAKAGTDTLTLSGTNTYTGSTNVNAGTLKLVGGTTLADTSTIVMSNVAGATLEVTSSEAVGALAGGGPLGGNIILGSGVTLTTGGNNSVATFAGVISGAGGITKVGNASSVQYFDGVNTYDGVTTVSGGYLVARSNAALGSTVGGTVVLTGATLQLEKSGIPDIAIVGESLSIIGTGVSGTRGALATWTGNDTFSGPITLTGSSTIFTNPGSTLTLSGNITESSPGFSLTKLNTGSLFLNGTNSYTGPTTISAGLVQFGTQGSLYSNNTVGGGWIASNLIVASGATAAFNVGGTNEFTATDLQTLSALGTATTGFASGSTLGIDTTNAPVAGFTYSSAITNTNSNANVLNLRKFGTGTLTLDGANTYTGSTTVTQGTLDLGALSTVGSTTLDVIVADTAALTATLAISGGTLTARSITIGQNGTGTLNISGTATATANGNSGQGGFVVGLQNAAIGTVNQTGGTVTVNNNYLIAGRYNTAQGTYNISAGTLKTSGSTAAADRRMYFGWDSATATGALNVSGAANVIVNENSISNNAAIVAGNNGTGQITIADTATVTINANGEATFGGLDIGYAGSNTSTYTQTGGTVSVRDNFIIAGFTSAAKGIINLSAGTLKTTGTLAGANRRVHLGWNTANNQGTLNVSGTGNLIVNENNISGNTSLIAGNVGKGVITVADNATMTINAIGETGFGGLEISYNGAASAPSTFTQTGGTVTVNNNYIIAGRTGTADGTISVSGGTLSTTGTSANNLRLHLGNDVATAKGTLNVSGTGQVIVNSTNVAGNFTGLLAGFRGNATINISDTAALTVNGATDILGSIQLGGSATSLSTINLNGGTLTTNGRINTGGGTSTFNFNGGTLKANINSGGFLQGLTRANIRNGGAIIDTNGFEVAIAQPFTHSNIVGDNAIDGGFTKIGSGRLTLTSASTYTGGTNINAGTLRLGGATTVDTTNATVRLDASALPLGAVTTWTNLISGGAGNFTGNGTVQSGGSNFNGLNVMRFNGSQVLTNSTVGSPNQTVLYVGALENTSSATLNRRLVGGTTGNNWLLGFFGNTQDTAYNGTFIPGNTGTNNGTPVTTNARQYALTRSSGSGTPVLFYKNGALLGTGSGAQLTSLSLGGSFNENSAGSIGEVLVFNTVLSDAARIEVETYLQRKWLGSATTNVLPTTTAINIAGTGILDVNSTNQTVGSVTGSANSSMTLGSGTLATGTDNTSTTFAGALSAASTGTLEKLGTGTLSLTGTSNFSGNSVVSNGTLLVDGIFNATTGPITVAANTDNTTATLTGIGSITNPVTLNATPATGRIGLISAGTVGTIGTFTFNTSLAIGAGTISSFDVTNTTTLDQIIVNGALTVSTGAIVQVPTGLTAGTYPLFTFTSSTATAGDFVLQTLAGAAAPGDYSLEVTSTAVNLIVIAPPVIVTSPSDTTVVYGNNITLVSTATGSTSVIWQFSTTGNTNDFTDLTANPSTFTSGITSPSLDINRPSVSGGVAYSGLYYRAAYTNAAGTVYSTAAQITVTPKALTVSLTADDKTYDGTTDIIISNPPVLSGIVGSDDVSVLDVVGNFATPAPGVAKPVTITSVTLAGPQSANYTATLPTNVTATITPLNPVINNYTPNTGTIAGGTEVIFNGSNLTAAAITFDGIAASFVGGGSGTITVTTPAHAAGAVDIVITTPGGSLTLANGFTYVAAGATLNSVTANGVLSTFNNATTTYGPVSLADATTSSGFYTFSRIVSLELTFSDIVHVDDGAFTLYVGDIASPTYSLTNNAAADIITLGEGTSTIQLNFANANVDGLEGTSLQNGIWKLRVDYTKIRVGTASGPAAGTQTDFEWNEQIRRLFGDANGDGNVGPGDFTAFGTVYTLQDTDPDFNPLFNSNNNSSIDPGDFTAFGTNFGQSL